MATITTRLTDGGATPTHAGAPDGIHQPVGAAIPHRSVTAPHKVPAPRKPPAKPAAISKPSGHQGGLPSTGGLVRSRTGGKPPTMAPARRDTTAHKSRPKPVKHPVGGHMASRPTVQPKAPVPGKAMKTPTGVGAPASSIVSTSSPAPDSGGFLSGLDLFPIILLAGGALALWWLYTHRKKGKG